MDQEAQQQIIERLKQAQNVLVTVSASPSVDQLAACIGFTLLINKLGKHGTAVFSGVVPSTLEFLKPEDTIEPNTDSLRDFIIALDKSKADKLRYKVEDQVVKIFITPYRTSITEKDLEFSQGDFNVDAVVAIGVQERTDLDKAIVAHGRILHDATIISVNNKEQGNLGAINWVNLGASSLSEMLVELSRNLTTEQLDPQMATAFMTGIVAETDRFSNGRTNPRTMSIAAELMSAGANQQLIVAKLDEKPKPVAVESNPSSAPVSADATVDDDGSLRIVHDNDNDDDEVEAPQAIATTEADEPLPTVVADSQTPSPAVQSPTTPPSNAPSMVTSRPLLNTKTPPPLVPNPAVSVPNRPPMVMEPPALGAKLTANTKPEDLEPAIDPLGSTTGPAFQPILRHPAPAQPQNGPKVTLASLEQDQATTDKPATEPPAIPNETTTSSETTLQPEETQAETIEDARAAVDNAIAYQDPSDQPQQPVQSLGAQPISLDSSGSETPVPSVVPMAPVVNESSQPTNETPALNPSLGVTNPNIPTTLLPQSQPVDSTFGNKAGPSAPPPVPPPMLVSNGDNSGL